MVVYAPPAHVTCDMEHIGTKRFVCDSRISKKSLAESGQLVIPSRLNLFEPRDTDGYQTDDKSKCRVSTGQEGRCTQES